MNGLAASVAQPQQPSMTQQTGQMPTVEEIVGLLMEGASPEELEQMGIPAELIMEAISLLEQQLASQGQQQQAAAQPQGGGLAQSVVG